MTGMAKGERWIGGGQGKGRQGEREGDIIQTLHTLTFDGIVTFSLWHLARPSGKTEMLLLFKFSSTTFNPSTASPGNSVIWLLDTSM